MNRILIRATNSPAPGAFFGNLLGIYNPDEREFETIVSIDALQKSDGFTQEEAMRAYRTGTSEPDGKFRFGSEPIPLKDGLLQRRHVQLHLRLLAKGMVEDSLDLLTPYPVDLSGDPIFGN